MGIAIAREDARKAPPILQKPDNFSRSLRPLEVLAPSGQSCLLGNHQDIERLPRLRHVLNAGRQLIEPLAWIS